jgi:hypothetical protein
LCRCQYRGAVIELLPTEKSNILGIKSSLHHLLQFPNLFIAPWPTAVCSKEKAADRAVCTVGNCFPKKQGGDVNFKGLSAFSENLPASLFNDDLSSEPTFSQVNLAEQYL